MMKRTLIFSTAICASLLLNSAQAATTQELLRQGQWQNAAQQAADERDYVTATYAIQLLQECPSAAQPKGQNWNFKWSTVGADYAQQAMKQKLSSADTLDMLLMLGSHVGHQAQTAPSMGDILQFARDSKNYYEKAVQAYPNDLLAISTLATYYARSYSRGGIVLGITKGMALSATTKAARMFNETPDQTAAQQIRKGWAAFRIGVAYEGLNDNKLKPFFNAAIQLAEKVGGAEARCLANVTRVHLDQPITNY